MSTLEMLPQYSCSIKTYYSDGRGSSISVVNKPVGVYGHWSLGQPNYVSRGMKFFTVLSVVKPT